MWGGDQTDQYQDGLATYYAPGLIERVAKTRGIQRGIAVDFVALNRCNDIGKLVWLERDGVVTGPYRSVDCAQRGQHQEDRERLGRVVEVSYKQASVWSMIGPIPVRVWYSSPADLWPRCRYHDM